MVSGKKGGKTKANRHVKLADPPIQQQLEEGNAGAKRSLAIAGLFAGIGGLELGLGYEGHRTAMFCEIDPAAKAVLQARFPSIPLESDVRQLDSLPEHVDLLVGGFPCQDLSQAGKMAGIEGTRSGLVGEVFRLLRKRKTPWVLLENVPFMLRLAKGRALDVIISELEYLGYQWAYRVVNTQAFGIPQRRERVFLIASLEEDPRNVLFADEAGEPPEEKWTPGCAFGFYWTEGLRGLGAGVDCIPTLKGGSTIGIPSPPAILMPDGCVVTPDIRDAERLQGFPSDWTAPAETVAKRGARWKLVGNAITVNVAQWIGARLAVPGSYDGSNDIPLRSRGSWPKAAWNIGAGRHVARLSAYPVRHERTALHEFLEFPTRLLSLKATAGFLSRARASSLRFPPDFLEFVAGHLSRMESEDLRPTA